MPIIIGPNSKPEVEVAAIVSDASIYTLVSIQKIDLSAMYHEDFKI